MDERVFDHLFQCVYNDDRRRRQVSRNPRCGSCLSRAWHVTHDTLTWHSSLYKYCHIPWLSWVLTPGLKTSHNPLWSEYARPRNTLLFSAWVHSDYCQPRVSRCPGVWLIHRMPCDKPRVGDLCPCSNRVVWMLFKYSSTNKQLLASQRNATYIHIYVCVNIHTYIFTYV